MSINEDNLHKPEPDEQELIAALRNKDDIPILMDVIADEIKVKVSQEDYLFNAISEPIPVLSDVSEFDVENALEERVIHRTPSKKQRSKELPVSESFSDSEVPLVDLKEDIPTITEHVPSLQETEPESESIIAENLHVAAQSGDADSIQAISDGKEPVSCTQETESDLIEPDASAVVSNDEVTSNGFHDNNEEQLNDLRSEQTLIEKSQHTDVSSTEILANTTTFNTEDLQLAIEKAFVTLLPDLMEHVLKELSNNSKKDR